MGTFGPFEIPLIHEYHDLYGNVSFKEMPYGFFVWPLVALFGGNILLGVWVQLFGKKDNSWIDAWWSMSFLVTNIVVLILRATHGVELPGEGNMYAITPRMWLITSCVACWALRLSTYIWWRHKREDYRYKDMRERWSEQGTCVYYTKAFTFIYIGQGLFSFINNGSVLFVNIFSSGADLVVDYRGDSAVPKIVPFNHSLTWLDYVGAFVWLSGFLIEVMSDRQLANHLANPKPGTGKFIKSGLWRYSRHPNYFGEAVMWWGLFLIALNLHYGWVTVYAPAFITFFLRFVSGVPFPEKKYASNPEW